MKRFRDGYLHGCNCEFYRRKWNWISVCRDSYIKVRISIWSEPPRCSPSVPFYRRIRHIGCKRVDRPVAAMASIGCPCMHRTDGRLSENYNRSLDELEQWARHNKCIAKDLYLPQHPLAHVRPNLDQMNCLNSIDNHWCRCLWPIRGFVAPNTPDSLTFPKMARPSATMARALKSCVDFQPSFSDVPDPRYQFWYQKIRERWTHCRFCRILWPNVVKSSPRSTFADLSRIWWVLSTKSFSSRRTHLPDRCSPDRRFCRWILCRLTVSWATPWLGTTGRSMFSTDSQHYYNNSTMCLWNYDRFPAFPDNSYSPKHSFPLSPLPCQNEMNCEI